MSELVLISGIDKLLGNFCLNGSGPGRIFLLERKKIEGRPATRAFLFESVRRIISSERKKIEY